MDPNGGSSGGQINSLLEISSDGNDENSIKYGKKAKRQKDKMTKKRVPYCDVWAVSHCGDVFLHIVMKHSSTRIYRQFPKININL